MLKGRAVRIRGTGGLECLEVGDAEFRSPGPGEVLVAIAAAGLNRADILQRRGFYPAPPGAPADIPGLEFAGTVVACGAGVRWEAGARVMGIIAGGAMATHVLVHERELMEVPDGMELVQAAAIPQVFLTAFDALEQGGAAFGDCVLVHAVGSGVGGAAIQLASAMGAVVVGTSRTRDKLERASEFGLAHRILVTDQRFASQLLERTGGRGADVIIDTVGAAYLEENIRSLAQRGRVIGVGLLGGATGSMSLALLLAKRAQLIGTVLRSRALEEKIELTQRFARRVLPGFSTGAFSPVVAASFPVDDIRDAHALLESNATFGKIVVTFS